MIDIWDYNDADIVRITDIDGREYTGHVQDVTDVGEESEDYGFGEDSITISDGQTGVVLGQSEIVSIEILRINKIDVQSWIKSMQGLGFSKDAIDRRVAIYLDAERRGAVVA